MERRDCINVLMPVAYAKSETGGVARWAVEAKPYIEDKTGGKVIITFPAKEGDDQKNLPPDFYFLGKVFRVPFQHHDTHYESSGFVKPQEVKKLIKIANMALHIVQFEEPLALPGVMAKGIIKGVSDKEFCKTPPGLVAHLHVHLGEITNLTRFGINAFKTIGYHRSIMEKMDRTLAVSQATVDTWSQFWPVHYDIVPNGINTDELSPNGPIINEWKKDGKRTILFAGRHDRRKGIDDLLRAYKLLRRDGRDNLQLKITGQGYMTEELKRMVEELNIPDVEFLGILPREEFVKAYRTCDVFVGPSTDGEAFNRTNAEALSCGTMIVTTSIPGHRYAFGQTKGAVFVKPRNPEDLARGIATVLDISDEDRKRLGRQGREHIVNNYSWSIIATLLVGIYQEIIASRNSLGR